MKKINKIIIVSILAILLDFACTPQKRINRILNRHPELKKDTVITYHDTTVLKAFTFDTVYNFKNTHDTVVLERRNYQVKVYHHNDTIFLKADVKADTIFKTIKMPFKQIVYTTDDKKRWLFFWIGSACVLLCLAVLVIVLKWIKP